MKRVLILTAVVIAAVALFLKLRPPSVQGPSEGLQVFMLGTSKAKLGLGVLDACRNFADHRRIFCIEGYFYQRSHDDLAKADLSVAEIYRRHSSEINQLPPVQQPLWAVCLGLAWPDSQRPVREAIDFFVPDKSLMLSHFADGWGVQTTHRQGWKTALEKCGTDFGDKVFPACAWGAGRGQYLFNPKNKPPNSANIHFRNGFEFASRLTHFEVLTVSQINTVTNYGAKTAEILKLGMMEKPIENEELKNLFNCYFERHETECGQ